MLDRRALIGCGAVLAIGWPRAATAEGFHAGKRVMHVDSYHEGNEWNDRIGAAIRKELEPQGIEIRRVFMNAKRRSSEDEKLEAARQVLAAVDAFSPDVVITSDDDAAKYVVADLLKSSLRPVVFCGINWDAAEYGLPFANSTGMVEVSPIPQLVGLLRKHARGPRIAVLAEDTYTKRKEIEHHAKLFGIRYDRVYLVSEFEDWKAAFRRAQDEADMLVVLGVGAVSGWDAVAAGAFAEAETRIPTGTDFEWLMPVALYGVVKLPEEQGRWAARAALRILDGVPPSRIPPTYNRESDLYFNPRIGRRLGLGEPPPLARLSP
jgi:ABC-type uncharacterized transport system substrate-binding protein